MKLDLLAAQVVAWARMVERAVHDSGPWTFRTSAGITPAHRLRDDHRAEVVFTGVIHPGDGVVELWCRDEMVSVTAPSDPEEDILIWRLSLKEPTQASS